MIRSSQPKLISNNDNSNSQHSKERLIKRRVAPSPMGRNSHTVLTSKQSNNKMQSDNSIVKSNSRIQQLIKESKTSPKKIRFDPDEEVHNRLDLSPINIIMDGI
jgi:hypothetical protein